MVQVNIYYETLDTDVTEEKPAYDLNDFGCKYKTCVKKVLNQSCFVSTAILLFFGFRANIILLFFVTHRNTKPYRDLKINSGLRFSDTISSNFKPRLISGNLKPFF